MQFTARNVAKYVVKTAVHSVVAQRTQTTIIDHTRFEEGDFIVTASSHVVGWGVSETLKPHTDRIVDKIADRVAARKNKQDITK